MQTKDRSIGSIPTVHIGAVRGNSLKFSEHIAEKIRLALLNGSNVVLYRLTDYGEKLEHARRSSTCR